MSRPAIGYDDSSELIQRAVALQIVAELPAQIELQQIQWVDRDLDWAKATGRPLTNMTIKTVNPKSVYTGHRLSLQDAPQNTFPAIACRCFNSVPSADREQPDQYDSQDLALIIEVWVSTGPYDDPVSNQADSDEIDRQLHRTTSAVRGCIVANRSIGNTSMGVARPPRVTPSLPFVRNATEKNVGPKFLIQAVELAYTITSLSY